MESYKLTDFIKTITLECGCPQCRKKIQVELPERDYIDWENGNKTQSDAFPYFPDWIRDWICGICPDCDVNCRNYIKIVDFSNGKFNGRYEITYFDMLYRGDIPGEYNTIYTDNINFVNGMIQDYGEDEEIELMVFDTTEGKVLHG